MEEVNEIRESNGLINNHNIKPLNIFYYEEKKNSDEFKEIKSLLGNMKDKLIVKGEFTKISLFKEISYYLQKKDEKRGKIKIKEIKNVIIAYSSFENAKDLLTQFIGVFQTDEQHFFIFINDTNNSAYNIKELMSDIDKLEKRVSNFRRLDSRNISFETKNTILQKIENIFDYFNENDEKKNNKIKNIYFNVDNNNVNTYTINILMIGNRGAGKSTIINRLLGEKKAFANKDAKTLNTKEYYHRFYPLKLVDSAGFEIGESKEITNVDF